MTLSLNRVQLIGNLGADSRLINGKNGQFFVTAMLATKRTSKQNDEQPTKVDWHQLIFLGKLVNVAEGLKKGFQVYVEGKLRSNQWTDNEGKTRQTYNIIVNYIQLLGSPKVSDDSRNTNSEHHMEQMRKILQIDSEASSF
ncbi:single-stranded DNA-binding protein [Legionella sainthelensi]|uniref:Single-stranded DNA-binding protein n=1 Tax=Legionella sainthelensi TaxID=28087 RepID=A0A2H5FM69_9GAMM|nr:single-stranded DNA-binding protein [Legionella sainthelensi]AUH72633.1 single-stranded DNA-binding protein [Legionella sainthelensi]